MDLNTNAEAPEEVDDDFDSEYLRDIDKFVYTCDAPSEESSVATGEPAEGPNSGVAQATVTQFETVKATSKATNDEYFTCRLSSPQSFVGGRTKEHKW